MMGHCTTLLANHGHYGTAAPYGDGDQSGFFTVALSQSLIGLWLVPPGPRSRASRVSYGHCGLSGTRNSSKELLKGSKQDCK
eukprot:747268-Hanusia_phi.AAC.1